MPEIRCSSISDAWLKSIKLVSRVYRHEVASLVVEIAEVSNEDIPEDCAVRAALNKSLDSQSKASVETVANTIFPQSLWNRGTPAQRLYERYHKILPTLRRYPQNRRGIYFERFINYPGRLNVRGFNQLQQIIQSFLGGNHRRSALQLAVLVPEFDLNNARQQGFPCLQQVAFVPDARRGTLAITGFYALQYLFSKAYGNYLGLARLGQFVAHEMGLSLSKVVCVAATAKLEVPAVRVKSLALSTTSTTNLDQANEKRIPEM